MSYSKTTAASVLALATAFGSAADAATKTVNLAWTASSGGTVCAYELWSRRLPGTLGDASTVKKKVTVPTVSTSVSVDDSYLTAFSVRALGNPPAGKTCADISSLASSGGSNIVIYGGQNTPVGAFRSINPYDGDNDGLPDNMETDSGPTVIGGKVYYHTYTNPALARTTTGCPAATDGDLYTVAESIRPYAWLNAANPYSNGLNNPNHPTFKAACDIVTRSKTTPAP